MSEKLRINMSSPAQRAILLQAISDLHGPHVFEIRQDRAMRSNGQLALYYSVYVETFRKYFLNQGQCYSQNTVDQMIRLRCLPEAVHDNISGEIIGEVPGHTTGMTAKEMGEFIDRVHLYLTEQFNIKIPSLRPVTQEAVA